MVESQPELSTAGRVRIPVQKLELVIFPSDHVPSTIVSNIKNIRGVLVSPLFVSELLGNTLTAVDY